MSWHRASQAADARDFPRFTGRPGFGTRFALYENPLAASTWYESKPNSEETRGSAMAFGITYPDILGTVGRTPLVWLKRVIPSNQARVLVKCEFFNPLSSVKDRIGRAMVEDAEQRGEIGEGSHIVEPPSGNTGIALAFVAAVKGYRLTLVIPDSMSHE